MKTAIVTGASGFIGHWLVRALVQSGEDVIAVVRPGGCVEQLEKEPRVRIVECDMHEYGKLPALVGIKNPSVFYHLAWTGLIGPSRSDPTIQLGNAETAGQAVQAAIEIGCSRFVGVGSLREYEALAELDADRLEVGPSCIYGEGKHFARFYTKALAVQGGLEHVWTVLSNVYGEGDTSLRFIINTTLHKILHHEPLEFTSGTQLYDFIHVEDTARALAAIGKFGVSGYSYIVGTGKPRPLREYIEKMGTLFAPERELRFGDMPYSGISLPADRFSIKKLTEDTGFVPEVPFEEGIKRTMEWIKKRETGNENI